MTHTLRHAIPNALSLSRLLLGLAFPWVPADWRLALIAVAAATDFLDGFAARLLRVESDFGRQLDPVADKVFVLVLVGTLIAEGTLHPLWALGLAARDVVVLAGVAWVVIRGRWDTALRMRPSWAGKCATAGQFAALVALVGWSSPPAWLPWLLAAVTALSVAAAIDYARRSRCDGPSPAVPSP